MLTRVSWKSHPVLGRCERHLHLDDNGEELFVVIRQVPLVTNPGRRRGRAGVVAALALAIALAAALMGCTVRPHDHLVLSTYEFDGGAEIHRIDSRPKKEAVLARRRPGARSRSVGALEQLVISCPQIRESLNRALVAIGNGDFTAANDAIDECIGRATVECDGVSLVSVDVLRKEVAILSLVEEELFGSSPDGARGIH